MFGPARHRLSISAILICVTLYLHSQPHGTLHHGKRFLMPLTFRVWYHPVSPRGCTCRNTDIRCTNTQTRGLSYKGQTGFMPCLQRASRQHTITQHLVTRPARTRSGGDLELPDSEYRIMSTAKPPGKTPKFIVTATKLEIFLLPFEQEMH